MSKRIPLPQVVSAVKVMESELEVAEARRLSPEQQAAAKAVRASLRRAEAAAKGEGKHWNRLANWWRGSEVESAYLSLHAARVEIIDLYAETDLAAEIPRAVARVQGGLHVDDPRRVGASAFDGKSERSKRAILRRLVEDGYEATDMQHERLRSFRNITLLLSAAVTVVVIVTLVVVTNNPDLLPLCFQKQPPEVGLSCPSSNDTTGPGSDDILVVALMGLMGGTLSAVFNLRTLRGTSAPYDAPVALAILKLPLGALTAIVGLTLVQGDFIPGLSDLDSQDQILAYALLFGVAQQVFTRFVDQKAQTLLDGLPSKDPESSPGAPITASTSPQAPSGPTSSTGLASASDQAVPPPDVGGFESDVREVLEEVEPGEFDEPPEEVQPNPQGDEQEQVQDDESDVIADVPEKDHT